LWCPHFITLHGKTNFAITHLHDFLCFLLKLPEQGFANGWGCFGAVMFEEGIVLMVLGGIAYLVLSLHHVSGTKSKCKETYSADGWALVTVNKSNMYHACRQVVWMHRSMEGSDRRMW